MEDIMSHRYEVLFEQMTKEDLVKNKIMFSKSITLTLLCGILISILTPYYTSWIVDIILFILWIVGVAEFFAVLTTISIFMGYLFYRRNK